ncbi:MAG: transcription factor S [Candidatus Nanohalarchaeota archaeon]|nr:MAG: transcription factor S [Candidatus Nanohaloarchaeota archaeon]
MELCKKCGSLMVPIRKKNGLYFVCRVCKTEKKANGNNNILKEVIHNEKPIIAVVGDSTETLPTIKKKCEKCGNNLVYWWSQQTRSSDEPETRFYRCTKCKQTWREYS